MSEIIDPLPSRGARRRLFCLAALLPVYIGIYYLAFWLRFDGDIGRLQCELFTITLPLVVMVKCGCFGWFRVYQGWGRHVTFHDLLLLSQAATTSSLLVAMGDHLGLPSHSIPRSVFLMDWGATILVVGGLRAGLRLTREGKRMFYLSSNRIPAMIVGTNESGEALLRTLRLQENMPYRVVGFIAQNADHLATCIGGVPVLGTLEETCDLADRHGVAEVLIAAGDLSGRQVRKLVEECRVGSVRVKVLPSYEELISGKLATQPRSVSIEDLLRREPVQLQMNDIRQWIDDQVVMVTGSAGSIGSEVCRQILRFSPKRLVLVDRSENGQFFLGREFEQLSCDAQWELCIADLNDELRMQTLFMRHRPDIIFHAAAYKHVPLMEAQPGEAVKNTTLSTYNLANMANKFGVKSFVMISSDKAVNPSNVMGACKRVGELYIQSLSETSKCRFVTVRFGNVLDSAGSVVPIFREQIARGGPVTVTDPRMQRYFMTIPEAAQLVIQAGTMGRGGEIFVLDMGEPMRIVDLAADVIRLSGLRVGEDIEIEFIGLRPGEKLYEELHVEGETHLPTPHPKIMVAERQRHNLAAIRTAIERLRAIAEQPAEVIVAELCRIVPEYRPQRQPAANGRDRFAA